MHLSNQPNYRGLNAYIRLDSYGNYIPGSVVYRKAMPKQGTWRQLESINQCCAGTGDSYILVINNTTNGENPLATVSALSTADGRINWTGSIPQSGGMRMFVIPNSYDETFTLTIGMTGTYDGVDVNTYTLIGDGTISACTPSFLNGDTISCTFTTSATPFSQYVVSLSDD